MSGATIHTRHGEIAVTLYTDAAPKTVRNFLDLVARAFYDGLTWHRVVADLCCQTCCPLGTGTGGPGYVLPDEVSDRRHLTGSLSMANQGTPNSGGSQFFICHRPLPHLDGKHAVFGRVVTGIDVVYKIRQGDAVDRIVAP